MQLEGFEVQRNQTWMAPEELEGKQLWLFRLPKDVSISQLNGQKITIPTADAGEIATIDTDESSLVLRKAHHVEKDTFHVLLADEDAPLKLGPRFEGLISLQQLPKGNSSTDAVQRIVPYEHIPQQKDLTVRFMPIGSTTGMQELQNTLAERPAASAAVMSPSKKHKKSKKKQQAEDTEKVAATPAKARHTHEEPETASKGEKKKKKRESVDPEKEQSAKKKKKHRQSEH